MKTALIITLGARDLQVKEDVFIKEFGQQALDSLLNPRKEPYARKLADYLLTDLTVFNKIKSALIYPIIKPCMDKLKSEGQLPERIVFVVTDQPASVGNFHFGDTVSSAKVLSTLLQTRYKLKPEMFAKPVLVRENVNFLDSMYAFFEQQLNQKNFVELQQFDRVLLLNQGGIDAINFGLLFTAIKVYEKKLVQLCVDERTETCYEIGFVQQSLQQGEHEKTRVFCQRYTYSALDALELDDSIKHIANYASSRLHFDFESARHHLSQLRDVRFRTFMTEQMSQLTQVNRDDTSLLRELYINAKIHYHQAAYVDFLLRFFRIVEEMVRAAAVSHIGLSVYNHDKWNKELNEKLAQPSFSGLETYLNSVKVDGKALEYIKPTTTTFQIINHYYQDPLADFIDTILPLSRLRNKSIGAHDFEPVSKNLIDQKLASKQTTIEKVFDELDKYLNVAENPFDQINQQIFSML